MYSTNDYRSYELYHHGVLGQKWGHKNGPPYPLDASDHSAAEKKAGWHKSLDSGSNSSKVISKSEIRKAIEEELDLAEGRQKNAIAAAKLEKKINKAMGGRKINYDAVLKLQNARDDKLKDLSAEEIEYGQKYIESSGKLLKMMSIGAGVGVGLGVASGPAAPIGVPALGFIGLTGGMFATVFSKASKDFNKQSDILDATTEKRITEKLLKKYANMPDAKKVISEQVDKIREEDENHDRLLRTQEQNRIFQQQVQEQNRIFQEQVQQQIQQQLQFEIQNQINHQIQQQIINQQNMMRF